MRILIGIIIVIVLGISFLGFFLNFLIPSKWIFKYRYLYNGFIMGIYTSFMGVSMAFILDNKFNAIRSLIIMTFVIVAMMIFYFTYYYITYKRICKQIKFEKQEGEVEILSDSGILMSGVERKSGRLIITPKRLCFLCKDNINYNFYFNVSTLIVKMIKRFRIIPNGIYIKDKDKELKVYVGFSRYWVKEINKMINPKI